MEAGEKALLKDQHSVVDSTEVEKKEKERVECRDVAATHEYRGITPAEWTGQPEGQSSVLQYQVPINKVGCAKNPDRAVSLNEAGNAPGAYDSMDLLGNGLACPATANTIMAVNATIRCSTGIRHSI